MVKIYPIINTYNPPFLLKPNKKDASAVTTYPNVTTNISIHFNGLYPLTTRNRKYINEIVKLLKSDEVKRILILPHKRPDEDAIGSSLALKYMIEKATGKKADIVISFPLQDNIKFIDPENEIKIINSSSESKATIKEIRARYKGYDTIIGIDTSSIDMWDDEIYQALVLNPKVKHKIKIDHHPESNNSSSNYADINFSDASKESAAQVVMECYKAFGLDMKNVDTKITDALTLGIMGDSGQLKFARGEGIFKDVGILSRSTNVRRIMDGLNKITLEEFKSYSNILKNGITFRNDGIAYAVIDAAKEVKPLKNVQHLVLEEMSKVNGIKYYFTVLTNSKKPEWQISSQIRSNAKNIRDKILEIGGGGHNLACGFVDKKNRTPDEIQNLIIKKLQEVDKN